MTNLAKIIQSLGDLLDLTHSEWLALCLVSKQLNTAAIPYLYQRLSSDHVLHPSLFRTPRTCSYAPHVQDVSWDMRCVALPSRSGAAHRNFSASEARASIQILQLCPNISTLRLSHGDIERSATNSSPNLLQASDPFDIFAAIEVANLPFLQRLRKLTLDTFLNIDQTGPARRLTEQLLDWFLAHLPSLIHLKTVLDPPIARLSAEARRTLAQIETLVLAHYGAGGSLRQGAQELRTLCMQRVDPQQFFDHAARWPSDKLTHLYLTSITQNNLPTHQLGRLFPDLQTLTLSSTLRSGSRPIDGLSAYIPAIFGDALCPHLQSITICCTQSFNQVFHRPLPRPHTYFLLFLDKTLFPRLQHLRVDFTLGKVVDTARSLGLKISAPLSEQRRGIRAAFVEDMVRMAKKRPSSDLKIIFTYTAQGGIQQRVGVGKSTDQVITSIGQGRYDGLKQLRETEIHAIETRALT